MACQERARSLIAAARRLVGNGISRGKREAQIRRLEWQVDRQKAALGKAVYPLLQSGQVQTDLREVRERVTRLGVLVQRLEELKTRSMHGHAGHRDAGWVQALDVQDQRPRGRGRLMLRRKGARPDGAPRFEAWIESFVQPDGPALASGDHVSLLVETSNERFPVTVRAIEAEGSVVSVHWTDDELPATLRELGGD